MSIQVITPQPEFARILKDPDLLPSQGTSMGDGINDWFHKLMIQSGWGVSASLLLMLSLVVGVAIGGGLFVLQENPLSAAVGFLLGAAIPVISAVVARQQRQNQMSRQLPGMIDELARAARTGRSLEHCLKLVANDTSAPLGVELRQCTRKLELGVPLPAALSELPLRTGLIGASVLSTALIVHRQTGGDLILVLERLSRTIRDRQEFQGRLRAQTAASRATAILMVVLPPVILSFFMFRDPDYLPKLLNSPWGSRSLLVAGALMCIGVVWVIRILQSSNKA